MAQQAHDGSLERELLTIALGAIGIGLLARYRRYVRPGGVVAVLLLLYVCWSGLSLTWAADAALTFRRLIAYLLLLVFAAGLVVRMDLRILGRFILMMPIVDLVPGIIAEIRFNNFHPFSAGHRFGGTVHPNLEGASLSLGLIILCWMMWRSHPAVRRNALWGGAVLLLFLLMTGSRTSMIALSVALGCSALLVYLRAWKAPVARPSGRIALATGVLVVVLSGATAIAVTPSLVNAVGTQRDDGDVSELTGRTDVWQMCLSYAADHPLLGVGFEGFWTDDHIEAISQHAHWPVNQAHSAYLDQVLALGVIGTGFYLLLLVAGLSTCVYRFLRGDDSYGAWSALLIFALVHNLTESINVLPSYPNFVVNLLLLHLALIPWTTRPGGMASHVTHVRGRGTRAIGWVPSA
ncbi:MAG TPA: O-antigen ligase family protein [Vicinamibacterales bacterium]|nr:O-antigen ligase family protein [Vicinamibacterales bacterium]